jgi:hypothetical protein
MFYNWDGRKAEPLESIQPNACSVQFFDSLSFFRAVAHTLPQGGNLNETGPSFADRPVNRIDRPPATIKSLGGWRGLG